MKAFSRAEIRALISRERPGGAGAPDADGEIGSPQWLQQLCAAATRTVPASGAGISVMTDEGAGAVAASSGRISQSLEELQFTLGEGPCLDAFSARRPVLEPDLRARTSPRWPAYAPAALELGARAVFAVPLQIGAARFGVLDLYRSRAGSLSPQALTCALTFGEVAAEALLDGQQNSGLGRLAEALDRAVDRDAVVYQAQGMVMVDLGVSLTDAMARLRAHAYAADRPLHEVAADVVAGVLRLSSDGDDPYPTDA